MPESHPRFAIESWGHNHAIINIYCTIGGLLLRKQQHNTASFRVCFRAPILGSPYRDSGVHCWYISSAAYTANHSTATITWNIAHAAQLNMFRDAHSIDDPEDTMLSLYNSTSTDQNYDWVGLFSGREIPRASMNAFRPPPGLTRYLPHEQLHLTQ